MTDTITQLMTDKTDLGRTVTQAVPRHRPLADGEAALAIETFALTANNITYAAYGDAMRYWDFFPSGHDGFGMMPVWGFATVTESRVDGLAEGARLYGYYPMAEELIVQPVHVTERGFFDGSPHREALPTPYNQYSRATEALGYAPDLADHQMLMRPLFFTSWMLADFLIDNDHFNARQLILSSASSKTAYGCAFALQQSGVRLIGLTSPSNKDAVESLGLYDEVLTYAEVEKVDATTPSVYLDFSGRGALAEALHDHLGSELVHHASVGSASTTDTDAVSDQLEPKPTLFFAPDQIRKRVGDWGSVKLYARYAQAERAFLERVSDANDPWMQVEEHHGLDAAAGVIRELVDHGGSARAGHVVRLR
ncbi:MAG: hypothetical protein CMN27_05115 [Salinisphaera sp.]|nr:hypothetical protein [Salinisphaera sp.]